MKDRIAKILRRKNLTPSKFADIIGVQRSRISHIMSGRNNPTIEIVSKIVKKFPDVDLRWLMFGEGEENINTLISDKQINTNKDELDFSDEVINTNIAYSKPSFSDQEDTKIKSPSNIASGNCNNEIERIIVFYKNGSFKEFKTE